MLAAKVVEAQKKVTIGIIWKYVEFEDTYKSISEALVHGGVANNTKVKIEWICSDTLEKHAAKGPSVWEILKWLINEHKIDGFLIPWGFWERGVEGKIQALEFIRNNDIPFLGICLWMQVAVIEYARNVCGLEWANSWEFNEKSKHRVIDLMEEQKHVKKKWWTMRLWWYEALLKEGSIVADLYWKTRVSERHRHRYEVNIEYHDVLQDHWLVFWGMSPDKALVEFIELPWHSFFVGTQAHPEFKSRIDKAHPLFNGFIKACMK
jgi:CTP synthase